MTIQFFYNGIGYSGPAALSQVERSRQCRGASERWLKKWAGKSGSAGGGDRRGAKMRPGRKRTLAIMARALYADARSRRRESRPVAPAPTAAIVPPV